MVLQGERRGVIACERSFACTSIGGAAPDRSRHSAAIEAAVASHSSAGQHSFWMIPMKPSTWCMHGTCMHMQCACGVRAVCMRCTCGVHAAAHRLTRGDVVLDEESDPHAAEEDPVDVPVDHRLVRM